MAEVIFVDGKPRLVESDILLNAATATAPQETEAVDPNSDPDQLPTPPSPEGQVPSERTRSVKPEDVEWEEWTRRQEAVRDAAREFDEMDHGDIREYLNGVVSRELTDEEIGQFKHDITAQRVEDIIEILDHQLRSSVDQMRRSRRTVKVTAPKGWMRRAFNQLDERAVGTVAARLQQRGHDPEVISSKVLSRVKDEETRGRLEEALGKGELRVEFAYNEIQ